MLFKRNNRYLTGILTVILMVMKTIVDKIESKVPIYYIICPNLFNCGNLGQKLVDFYLFMIISRILGH